MESPGTQHRPKHYQDMVQVLLVGLRLSRPVLVNSPAPPLTQGRHWDGSPAPSIPSSLYSNVRMLTPELGRQAVQLATPSAIYSNVGTLTESSIYSNVKTLTPSSLYSNVGTLTPSSLYSRTLTPESGDMPGRAAQHRRFESKARVGGIRVDSFAAGGWRPAGEEYGTKGSPLLKGGSVQSQCSGTVFSHNTTSVIPPPRAVASSPTRGPCTRVGAWACGAAGCGRRMKTCT